MSNASSVGLVDAGEVARAVGVSRETVLRWAADGRIPVVRVNRRTLRFDLKKVLDSLAGK